MNLGDRSRASRRQRGAATVEYLALVALVAALLGGLLVLRDRTVGRRAPVDVITPVVSRLGTLLDPPRPRAAPPRPARTRPRASRPRRPPPTTTVRLPEWWR